MPVDNESITVIAVNIEGKDEHVARRMRIAERDLEKFGLTVGRAGCRVANRGGTHGGVQEEDHGGVGKGRRREGGEISGEILRALVGGWEEENKRKKAKTGETTGGINQAAASSSGGGGAEAQRSRGGVLLEITNKRKEDEDQQEQPEKRPVTSRRSEERRGLRMTGRRSPRT